MAYTEVVVLWTGPLLGLPGYSKFRFIGELAGGTLTTAGANLRVFLDAIKNTVPSGVTLTVQPSATWHDDDGTLTAEISLPTPPAAVVGTGAGAVLAAGGFMVRWFTGAINGGHKVEGRTYFVPTTVGTIDSSGVLNASVRTTVQTAANVYATSTPSPAVNSRKGTNNPDRGDQTVAILSATVPNKQVVMRSRRD